jgi:hypothetical protein
MNLPRNARTARVGRENIILREISHTAGIYEGEIARLRMTETPALGSLQGEFSELSLRADEGVAELTAFLFDSANQVLAIHSVREAVSPSRLAGFCDVIEASPDGFSFDPIIRTDTLDDFNHLQSIRKVEIKIASVAAAAVAPAAARSSVKGYFRLKEVAALEAETITITLGMGHARKRGMVLEAARGLVRGLLDNKDNLAVETLIVSGKEDEDEPVVLDLLRGRVREEIVIQVRGRRASYSQRQDAIREAYASNHALLSTVASS